ncbi:DivIVA protein [uncultured Clostridium sp.]|uniref:Uncharacterized protein n=1 Tax=Muricoprocola aceti TaxID=2981772 RepID=A0ABT2SQH9_9FIRM|nr:hypothetical protein [Muricoprocola aceti]MCI7227677.1 hypothetical protein [Lachnospiraceae bacterium]SCH93453.1 DivIVA protein [uncultured Clostridium sp.]MCU6726515.1 hypothetical protein [Muricoprocola aceti]MDD7435129.1 hypothetical protein [Lachnospiraceae bacterium]MDY3341861.1 hypothetical protein [Lachnospiraceae bacterium]
MSVETEDIKFRTAFMGYQKSDVDAYVTRVKIELEEQEKQQKKLEEELQEQRSEIEDQQKRLDGAEKKYEDLKREYEEYRNRMEAEGADPKTIQDAILNAQRMSEIVIVEAQQKAMDIREKARQDKKQQEEEGKKMVEDAKAEALRVTSEAELRCDSLQHEYDRILMDVTGFKAEIMKMYRKHMELLAALPPKEIVEAEEISQDQERE